MCVGGFVFVCECASVCDNICLGLSPASSELSAADVLRDVLCSANTLSYKLVIT